MIHSSAFRAGAAAKVAVDTTEVKNIWKANGAKPGMVLYEEFWDKLEHFCFRLCRDEGRAEDKMCIRDR